ncbi:MAG: caspase family protein, partial [Asticcacaulis sp.]|nr:caspase family protein [Asticcacaulis sp.]
MRLWAGLVAAMALWCAGAVAHADPARVALIINQVDYQSLTPLPDTDGEAAQVSDSLKKIGFDITTVRDANLAGLQTALKDFRRKLAGAPGAIGFIYYTGHGMADPTDDKGDNYLLGIDADV